MSPDPPRTTPDAAYAGLRVSRRTILGAGAGLLALGGVAACSTARPTTVEPRKMQAHAADDELPSETSETSAQPEARRPPLVTGSFVSAKMGGRVTRWAVARPIGVTGRLPVVLVCHALNTDEMSIFSAKLDIQSVLQSYVNAGGAPFAIAAADVGRNYFHLRTDGTDGAAMMLDEFLPMLASNPALDITTDRLGLYGWSMGGYGALRIAALVGAPRVAAVAVSSPALWADPRNYPPRAFDSIEDYQANSLFGRQTAFARIPLLINIGSSDQFFTYTRQWAASLHPAAAFGTAAGGHTNRYWRSVLPDQIEFLGRNLAR